ncbi:MAG: fibronectin type III domain-containing protein, partial [Gammaproteobacteria bacterium]
MTSAGLCIALLLASASAAARPSVSNIAIEANPTRLIVTWDVNIGSSALSLQRIRWIAGGPQHYMTIDTSLRRFVITGLALNTSYPVVIEVTNNSGTVIGNLNKDTLAAATAPHAPTGGMIVGSNQKLRASWTLPYDGGSALMRQEIRWGLAADISGASWVTLGAAATSRTITGLVNDAEYAVEVRAVNAAGDGAALSLSGSPILEVPGAPANLAVQAGESLLYLSWTTPDHGGSALIRHEVRAKLNSAGAFDSTDAWTRIDKAVFDYSFTGLTNSGLYNLQVRAVNADGSGAAAGIQGTPVSNSLALPAVADKTVTPGLPFSATLPPAIGGAPPYTYWLSGVLPAGIEYDTATRILSGTATDAATRGAAIALSHRVTDSAGASATASFNLNIAAATAPLAPEITQATPKPRVVTLAWSAPANNGGSPITTYRYRWANNNDPTWRNLNGEDGDFIDMSGPGETNVASFEFRHDNGAVQYTLAIGAENAIGVTWSSDVSVAAVTAFPPDTLNVESMNAALLLTWTAPGNNSGDDTPITDYRVRWRIKDSGEYQVRDTANAGLSYRITDLINGMIYQVQVASRNLNGLGRWSNQAEGTPAQSVPGTPAITSLSGTATSLMVSWSAPA